MNVSNLSITQAGNYTAFIPVIVLVLSSLDIKVSESELTNLIASIVAVFGILVSIYGRYRQGDVNALGVKKSTEDLR